MRDITVPIFLSKIEDWTKGGDIDVSVSLDQKTWRVYAATEDYHLLIGSYASRWPSMIRQVNDDQFLQTHSNEWYYSPGIQVYWSIQDNRYPTCRVERYPGQCCHVIYDHDNWWVHNRYVATRQTAEQAKATAQILKYTANVVGMLEENRWG